jgi:Zn-dependent M28 family amino/carboxypeptidase
MRTHAALMLACCACAGPEISDDPDELHHNVLSDPRLQREALLEHLVALEAAALSNGGHRAVGSPGYQASVDHVVHTLEALGLEPWLEPFDVREFEALGALLQADAGTLSLGEDLSVLTWSAEADVQALLRPVDLQVPPPEVANTSTSGCEAEDFGGFPAGSIALLQRGGCTFADKVRQAQAAGALGVVLFNEGQEGRRSTLEGALEPDDLPAIPVVGVSFERGLALADQIDPIRLRVQASIERTPTVNVLVDLPGDTGRHWLVGAHLDSVRAGPGINDNGTGVASLLALAARLVDLPADGRHGVRLAFWGAEEVGLVGSLHHAGSLEEAGDTATLGNLNFDMIGSPNPVRFVYDSDDSTGEGIGGLVLAPASAELEARFTDHLDARGLPHLPMILEGRTDYVGFSRLGLPIGGTFTGAEQRKSLDEASAFGGSANQAYDPCYHRACDRVDNVDLAVLEELTIAAADVIEQVIPADRALARRGPPSPSVALPTQVNASCHAHDPLVR